MSKLRDQLQTSREAYESIRYDGDLAADLAVAAGASVTSIRRPWQRWVGAAASLAAAAALVAFVFIRARNADAPTESGGVGMAVRADQPDPAAANGPQFAIELPSEVADATPTLWNSFESVPSMFAALDSAESGVPSFPSLSEVSASLENSVEDQK